MPAKCCDIVYWEHDDGWDAYRKQDCRQFLGGFVPNWFDCPIVEDKPTKAQAQAEIKDMHIFGICLVGE